MRFKNLIAFFILLLFLASCTLWGGFSKTRAMKDIKQALKKYPVTKITMVSFEKQAALNTSYYEVRCDLILHPKGCKPMKMSNFPFVFYFDQQGHSYILDKNCVANLREAVSMQETRHYMMTHPYYPDPWNHGQ